LTSFRVVCFPSNGIFFLIFFLFFFFMSSHPASSFRYSPYPLFFLCAFFSPVSPRFFFLFCRVTQLFCPLQRARRHLPSFESPFPFRFIFVCSSTASGFFSNLPPLHPNVSRFSLSFLTALSPDAPCFQRWRLALRFGVLCPPLRSIF